MSINSNYSLILIDKIREAGEISYYELKKFYDEKLREEFKNFSFNEELDNLEEQGIVRFDEGLIIFEGL